MHFSKTHAVFSILYATLFAKFGKYFIFSSKDTNYEWKRLNGDKIEFSNWKEGHPKISSFVTYNNQINCGRSESICDDFFRLKGPGFIQSDYRNCAKWLRFLRKATSQDEWANVMCILDFEV